MIKRIILVVLLTSFIFVGCSFASKRNNDSYRNAVTKYCTNVGNRLKDIARFRDAGVDRKDLEDAYIQSMIKNDYIEEYFVEMLLWMVVVYNRTDLNEDTIEKHFLLICYRHFE